MASSRRTVFQFLPLLVFPIFVAWGSGPLWGHTAAAAGTSFLDACSIPPGSNPDTHPHRLAYTSVEAIDDTLCTLVTFFVASLHPSTLPFVADFLANFSPLVLFPFVESARSGSSPLFLAGFAPVLLLGAAQLFTAGLSFPVFWALFFLTRNAHLSLSPGPGRWEKGQPPKSLAARITNADALALLFAFVGGYLIPTVAMLIAPDDSVIVAVWQAFPLWMFALQQLHVQAIRRRSAHPEPGYNWIKLLYGIAFVLSAVPHMAVIWPRVVEGQWEALGEIYVPYLQRTLPVEVAKTMGMTGASVELLKWDAMLLFSSSSLAALFFAQNVLQAIGLAVWLIAASFALGPGAALSAVFLWREAKLNA